MEKKKDGRGRAAQLEKEVRELQAAQVIKDAQLHEANRKLKAQGTQKVIWTNRFQSNFNDQTKSNFIRDNRSRLRSLFLYADERKRRLKRQQYETVITLARDDFERWIAWESSFDWTLHALTLVESWSGGTGIKVATPEEDSVFITFTHPGLIYSRVGESKSTEDSVTPFPIPIMLDVKIQRYEVNSA